MQKFKRFLAGILTLVMLFTSVPVQAFAVQDGNNAEASMDSQDVDFEGTNAVGTLLAEAIAEEQQSTIISSEDTPYEDGYTLTEIVVQGSVATVTYDALEEAQLVVALYSEDGMQLLNTAKTTVTADATTATVTFSGEMPQYFVAAAFLLDVYDYSPLCPSYETPMYTQDMQELLAMTVEDCVEEYGEERIYNLDDNAQTNFAVYAEGTVLLYEEAGVNTVTSADMDNMAYTIENADERVTSLTEGSVVVYEYADGELLLIKVSTITVDGTTVTIQGMDMEIEEVFAIMKVEADAGTEDTTFDDTDLDENMMYLGTDAPQTYEYEGSIGDKMEHTFYFWGEKEDDKDEDDVWNETPKAGISGKGTFEGTFTLGIEANLKFYISLKRQFLEFKVTPSATLQAELSGYINFQTGQLGKGFDIYLCPGVYAHLHPTFNLKFSGKITLEAKLFFDLGMSVEHRSGGNWQCQDLSTTPKVDPKLEFEGKVFIGFDFHPGVKVISDKVCKADLTSEIGVELTAKLEYKIEDYSGPTIHDCNACVDGDLSLVWRLKLELEFLSCEDLKIEHTFLDGKLKLFDFYWSWDTGTIDFGECPNFRYRIYVKVMDENQKIIEDAEVYYLDAKAEGGKTVIGTTNANGIAMDKTLLGAEKNIFLPKGSYTFETVVNGEPIRSPEPVKVYTYTSAVLTSSKEYWERQAQLKKLRIEPDEVKAGSILKSDVCGDSASWRMYSSGLLEIYGEGAMDSYSSASKAPWYRYKDRITSLRVGDKVTSVGNYAFNGYTKLKKVILEDSVTTVGQSAFAGCSALKEIKMPVDLDFVTYSNYTFYGCTNITNIHYTYGQTGKMTERKNTYSTSSYSHAYSPARYSYESLTGVYFDEGITDIISGAFSGCTKLTSAAIPITVTSIGNSAFYNCYNLEQFDIPAGLTYLGSQAFYNCQKFTDITIPAAITAIPAGCFQSCTGLTELVIPDTVTTVYQSAFAGCSNITKLTMPVDLDFCTQYNNTYNYYSFYGMTNIKEIIYTYGQTGKMTERQNSYGTDSYSHGYSPEKFSMDTLERVVFDSRITHILGYAYSDCVNLVSAPIPAGVTYIGNSAFYNCYNLEQFDIPAGLTYLGTNVFYNCQKFTDITIPAAITAIPAGCFQKCTGLTELVIPDTVTSLDRYAFAECSNITKLTMPVDLDFCTQYNNTYNYYSFYGMTNIKEIIYTYGQTGKMTERQNSYGTDSYSHGYSPEKFSMDTLERVVFDSRITHILDNAYSNCENLVSAPIPAGVTYIGNSAFYNCYNLEQFDIPAGLTYLGSEAFYNCDQFKSITIPAAITTIPTGCFRNCHGLTELVIPDTVTALAPYAFAECSNITKLTMPVDLDFCTQYNNTYNYYSFYGMTNIKEIIYTYGQTGKMTERESTYGTDSYSHGYSPEKLSMDTLERVVFDSRITHILDNAYSNCENLVSAPIPAGVTYIGNSAFYNCYNLEQFDIPAGLTYLGTYAFYNCQKFKEITIPAAITAIPAGCFQYCTGLTELVIPDTVTSLDRYAFAECSNITKLTMPVDLDFVTQYSNTYDHHSFYGMTNIKEIIYTYGQTGKMTKRESTYGADSYNHGYSPEKFSMDTLERVVFDSRITHILDNAYSNCENLVSAPIPAGVTYIGNSAFYNCYNLEQFDIPAGLTYLGSEAFYNCDQFKSITIPAAITNIPYGCFRNCHGLTELVVPDTVTSLDRYAFAECSNITKLTMPVDLDFVTQYSNTYDHHSFYGMTNIKEIIYTYGQTGKMTKRESTYGADSYNHGYSPEKFSVKSLKQVTFADGILDTVSSAFSGASSLSKVLFLGDSLSIGSGSFSGVTADALYPYGNETWTEDLLQNYGGTLTWMPYILDEDGNITTDFDPIPEETEPEETEPEETEPEETEPEETEPTETEPVETEPEETDPTEPTESEPTEPTESEPTEPTGSEPTEPTGSEPTEPTGSEPTEPTGSEPTEPTSADPTDPSVVEDTVPETTSDMVPSSASAEPEVTLPVQTDDVTNVKDPAKDAIYGGMNEAELEDGTGEVIQNTYFSGLVPGAEYVMFALASIETEDLLAPDNILYIGQQPAGDSGTLTFRYIQKEETDNFNVFACGASHKHLRNATISFPKMEDNGELRVAEPTITYGGETLIENVDYVVLDGQGASDAGDYICTIRGIRNYTGLITCSYSVDAAYVEPVLSHVFLQVSVNGTSDNPRNFVITETLAADGIVTLAESMDFVGSYYEALDDNGILYDGLYLQSDPEIRFDQIESIHELAANGEVYILLNLSNAQEIVDEPEIEKINLSGTAMTLGNSLSMDFGINISKLENNGEGHYAIITKHFADGREDVVTRVDRAEWKVYSGSVYTASCTGISAKEMCDEVEIVVYNADGYAVTNAYSDSVKSYAMRTLNNTNNQSKTELLITIVDMLNYGAAAQEVFGYDTANPANADLTDAQKALATTEINPADARVKGPGYAGSTLTLKSEILLDFVFYDSTIGTDFTGMYAIATYTNHYGNLKEIRLDEFKVYASGYHYVSVSGMAVSDCGQLVTCTVYNSNGEAIASASDSVEGYIARQLASGRTDAVYTAILKFAASAYNYFH